MRLNLYPRLAAQNIVRQRRFFYPYILTIIGSVAAFFIVSSIAADKGLLELRGAETAYTFAQIGVAILALFCIIFLFYTNSFLMKRRNKEIGLYNILGMGKPHIAAIMAMESLIVWLVGLGLGLLCGALFYRLAALVLYRLSHLQVPFTFVLSQRALVRTTSLFSVILLVVLVRNLLRVGRARPIELLHGDNAGEKEPRTRWLLTLIGVLSLGGGYWIAIWTDDPMSAVALYFVAVLLVIIGTYCLFTSVSIAVLKLLRANKRFYYKTSHFINISGMLYRMKQNAVGLANICILSTMVLVMVSGTLSLYIGAEDAVRQSVPADVVVNVSCDADMPITQNDGQALAYLTQYLESDGRQITRANSVTYLKFACSKNGSLLQIDRSSKGQLCQIAWMTAQNYAAAMGSETPQLQAGEVLVSDTLAQTDQVLTLVGVNDVQASFRVLDTTPDEVLSDLVVTEMGMTRSGYIVVADDEALANVAQMQREVYGVNDSILSWEAQIDTDGTPEEKIESIENLEEAFDAYLSENGGRRSLLVSSQADARVAMFGMAGGFLFLGVFLGLVFIMAAVLIIYYKQISEGYEDRERFRIMQQVGLEKRQIRSCINMQILTVFFLPLVVCAIHLAFDFGLMTQLLYLFGITNIRLTAICSVATMGAFALLYAVVYLLTARTYNKIVAQ